MSRKNAVVAVLLMAAVAVLTPALATAQTSVPVLAIAGSSALWQSMGLAAFQWDGMSDNKGACAGLGVNVHPPCYHYTDNTKFNLNDTRPTTLGGQTNVDNGDLWIVWDTPSAGTRNVWVYINVDSVVGDRCYFAQPQCNITVPSGYVWSTVGQKIGSSLWGADQTPPADVEALFGPGVVINTAATDIRPEDAQFAVCRVNSNLGNGTLLGAAGDGLDGLGYANNSSGTCPAFGAGLSALVGTPIQSGVDNAPIATANPLAFNISGHDPFTNESIPAHDVVNVGAAPIVFMFSRSSTINSGNGLRGAVDASDANLQTIFSGTTCDASVLAGTTGNDPINAYLREPLSGTMNTTEASVFRRPVNTVGKTILGVSQEANVGNTNPLSGTVCNAGGGTRSRVIGTGEMVKGGSKGFGIKGSGGSNNDGIGYAFFSFGNVSPIAGSANYGYLTLDGQDPIGITGNGNELPLCSYPCPTNSFAGWTKTVGKKTYLNSFPSLRSGHYSAWSVLRLVTSAERKTKADDLAKASYGYDVNFTSDFIPVDKTTDSSGNIDRGLVVWHTHYQQRDGDGNALGPVPSEGKFNTTHNPDNPAADDAGGDMGGCTKATRVFTKTSTDIDYIQTNVADPFVVTCAQDRN